MTESKPAGVNIFGVVFICFLILKLTDLIDWSWWWVTAPMWAPVALFIASVLIMLPFTIYRQWKWRRLVDKTTVEMGKERDAVLADLESQVNNILARKGN